MTKIITQSELREKISEGDQWSCVVSHFNNKKDKWPKQKAQDWEMLKKLFADYNHKDKDAAPRVSFTQHAKGTTRRKANVVEITALVFDIDDGYAIDTIKERLETLGLSYIIYSTTRHTPEKPRYRIIIPLLTPIKPKDWPQFFKCANQYFCDGHAETSYGTDWSHLSNLPNCLPGADKFSIAKDGMPLEPDQLPPLPRDAPQPPTNTPQSTSTPPDAKRLAAYGAKAKSNILAKFLQTPEGMRNIELNNTALGLGHLVGGNMLTRDECQTQLEASALALGMKYTEDNILETIKSGLDKGITEPKRIADEINGMPAPASIPKSSDKSNVVCGFPCDDIGNGQRFASQFTGMVRWCESWKKWLIFNGRYWQSDTTNKIDVFAKETARNIISEAQNETDEDKRYRLLKHATATSNRRKREAMLIDAKSEPGLSITPDDFDKDPWLLNTNSGTVNLKTGKLQPHNPNDLINKIAPVDYVENATCPLWLETINKIFNYDAEMIRCYQTMMGYCISASTKEQNFLVEIGSGANGKDTTNQPILDILGTGETGYAIEVDPKVIMIQKNDRMPHDIAALHNKRLVITTESNDTQRLDEDKLKRMTGEGYLTGERKYEAPFTFKPVFKLLLATNALPEIRGTDHSIWRRVVTIPFDMTFWKNGEVPGDPKFKADPDLKEKLKAEYPGILRWLVEGCLMWQREGLQWPKKVTDKKATYREEQDVLAPFLAECCIISESYKVSTKTLGEAYRAWSDANNEKTLSSKALGTRLKEHGFTPLRTNQARFYFGIGIKETNNPEVQR